MKILIIQTAFIGDVVLATALIEKLKSTYPESNIDFVVRKGNESILHEHPLLNKVWIFDKRNKYSNLFRLIKGIRSQSYDYVINAQRFFTTGLITALSGGKVKIGFDKNPLSFLFTQQVKHHISEENGLHEVERNHSLIESLTDHKAAKPRLYFSQKDAEVVPKDYKYMCIAPASVWFTKQYPAEKWCELIRKIPKDYVIHLIGGPQDISLCENIKAATDANRVKISAGKTSILQSVALIKHADMTFTNDSAAMHFASAVNAPVTAIYCSTIPQFGFGPLSDNSTVVETDMKLSCRPCGLHGKKACPESHFNCATIHAEDILRKADINHNVN